MHREKSEIKYDEYNIESFDLTPIEIDWKGKHFGLIH
jgi:hypothetical protein